MPSSNNTSECRQQNNYKRSCNHVCTSAKNLSYTLGHNEFSDLTWDDFKSLYVGKLHENPALHREKDYDYSLLNMTVTADAVDWVAKVLIIGTVVVIIISLYLFLRAQLLLSRTRGNADHAGPSLPLALWRARSKSLATP